MSRSQNIKSSWRIPRTGLVAAIVTFLVLCSSVGAYAYWSAQASLTSTAKAGSISITFTGFGSLLNTFVNDTRTVTGSVTVKNTSVTASTLPIPMSIDLGYVAGGSSVLATNLDVTMWGPTTAASCTPAISPSGTIKAGTWASFPSMTDTLVAQQSKTWCVRTSNDERSKLASAGGTISLQPTATATLTAGSWIATASATTTQNTQFIYPQTAPSQSKWYFIKSVVDGRCLDANGNLGATTEVILWPCKPASDGNDNQQWQFGDKRGTNYFDLKPKHAQTTRWDAHGSGAAGTVITIESPPNGSDTQHWQFQQAGANQYQIVNKLSGLCVQAVKTLSGGQTAVGQAFCDGSNAQQFIVEIAPTVLNLVCSNAGNDVVYSWSASDAGIYTFQANDSGWKTVGVSGASSSQITIDGTQPAGNAFEDWNNSTYDLQAVDANGNQVGTGQVKVKNQKLSCK